jgi:hypothetical protein
MYKPKTMKEFDSTQSDALGWLVTEFEGFEPDSTYDFTRASPLKSSWKIIQPKTAPVIWGTPEVIKDKLKKVVWNFAPSSDAQRGQLLMGTRGYQPSMVASHVSSSFQAPKPGQLPYKPAIHTKLNSYDQRATDWKEFGKIERTNAVSFRGDTRTPLQVLKEAGGFYPPNTRTDRYYLENGIYEGFAYYMKERFNTDVAQADFLKAVDKLAPTFEDKKLLADYFAWRKLMESESGHLGRMTDNELLKGYISTARAVDTSIDFATNQGKKDGWLYLVVVHGGFIVPAVTAKKSPVWGTLEGEIAQLGAIPTDRIVGFRRVPVASRKPEGPIFIRRSFRKGEPEAFEKAFKIMSGMLYVKKK